MQGFSYMLVQTIRDVVTNIFDDETGYRILEHTEKLLSENLDETIKLFDNSLVSILGKGAVIVEDLIVEELYLKCGANPKLTKGHMFQDCVLELAKLAEAKSQ